MRAATRRLAALPDITGQPAVKAALPAADSGAVFKAKVRELVEKLTPKTAKHVRQELMDLMAAS